MMITANHSLTTVVVVLLGLCLIAWTPVFAQTSDVAQAFELTSATTAAPETASPESIPSGEPGADLDQLLNMDVEQLSKLDVSVFNPVIEGVSKKEERLSESPGIVDVITAEDIEQFGAKNLYEVLHWATSVYMTGSFLLPRNMASIRGNLIKHEDNHVLILINGRPYRDISYGGVNTAIYTAFPIQTIERVEVMRGPGSVLYGTNAFTGVINVVTKDPDKPTMHASVLSGSYGWQSYSVAAGNGNEHQGAYAGSTYSRSKGWPFTATEDAVAPAPQDTDTAPWGEDNIGLFVMYRHGNFTANVFAARATQEMLGPDGAWPSDRLKSTRVFADLGYLIEPDDCQSLDLHFTYNFDNTLFPSLLATAVADDLYKGIGHSYLAEGTYRAKLTRDLDFMIGGLVDFHQGVATIMNNYDPIPAFTEIWYGVYMQMEYQASDWLKLVGGMQGNMPGDIQGGIVPRAAAIVSLNENWTAKFLYGQSFRSPYQTERSIDIPGLLVGNPDLEPETMQTFDVQLAYHTEDFRFAATYYHSDFFDVVTRVSFAPQSYVNQGRIEFQGIELENEWEISERLRWLGSMTYQENTRDFVENTTSVPNWMAKMGVAYHNDCSGWTVGLMDTFFGRPTVPATAAIVNPQPAAYHLTSLNTTLDLDRRFHCCKGRSMQLQFLVQNLFNERIDHIEFERELINTLPAGPGQTFYGGFTMAY